MFDSNDTVEDSPERRLIASSVMQAICDAFMPAVSGGVSIPAIQKEAIDFLTAETGDWARSRTSLCDALGLEASSLRSWAVAVLEGANFDPSLLHRDPRGQGPSHSQEVRLEAARKIWRDLRAYHSSDAIAERREAQRLKRADLPHDEETVEKPSKHHITSSWRRGPDARDLEPMLQSDTEALTEDDCFFLVAKSGILPKGFTINGFPRPHTGSHLYFVLKAVTSPEGATIKDLEWCTKDWRMVLKKLEQRFNVAAVWLDKQTVAIMRRPLERAA